MKVYLCNIETWDEMLGENVEVARVVATKEAAEIWKRSAQDMNKSPYTSFSYEEWEVN